MTRSKHPVGVIHGRFQVLHNDHLRYLLAGKERCDHLVIGVTNPDPSCVRQEQADPGRGSAEANPLTYYERQVMVRKALVQSGVRLEDFSIVPLPISQPELYRHYVPLDAVFFLTVYDDWGRAKKARFEALGLQVEVLWERSPEQKGLSGEMVRRAIMDGSDWRKMVPAAVAELVEQWGLSKRLRSLEGHGCESG